LGLTHDDDGPRDIFDTYFLCYVAKRDEKAKKKKKKKKSLE
jgi:hypothetical protein